MNVQHCEAGSQAREPHAFDVLSQPPRPAAVTERAAGIVFDWLMAGKACDPVEAAPAPH